jgi:hypothetical protein
MAKDDGGAQLTLFPVSAVRFTDFRNRHIIILQGNPLNRV